MIEDPEHVKKVLDKSKSLYDQSRDTVGKIYRDANMNNHEAMIEVGDMSREMTTSLVEDMNKAIGEFDLGIGVSAEKIGKPYYLMIHEKKDLQMKRAILRRMLYFGYRPWPEDDTVVFWRHPKKDILRFCWALPHWSEMENILHNPDQFCPEFVFQIKSWKDYQMRAFGFYYKDDTDKWVPNPKWRDQELPKPKTAQSSEAS